MPSPPRRTRFQIHLSTAIVLMFISVQRQRRCIPSPGLRRTRRYPGSPHAIPFNSEGVASGLQSDFCNPGCNPFRVVGFSPDLPRVVEMGGRAHPGMMKMAVPAYSSCQAAPGTKAVWQWCLWLARRVVCAWISAEPVIVAIDV